MSFAPGDFLADVRMRPAGDGSGRYHATISPAWNIVYVFGGITMAAAVSAARAACSQPDFELRSATAAFLAPMRAGDISLEVRALRRGKGAEQLAVDLYDPEGRPALHVVTTLGPTRESDTRFVDLRCPEVPSPAALPSMRAKPGSRMAMTPYAYSVESKPVPGEHRELLGDRARWLGWQRFHKSPRREDGLIDPLAYIPAADMIGPALHIGRGPGASKIMLISLEICLHFYARTASDWLLQDTQIYQASDGYASGVVHLWDEERRLVAHALQRAVLRPRAF